MSTDDLDCRIAEASERIERKRVGRRYDLLGVAEAARGAGFAEAPPTVTVRYVYSEEANAILPAYDDTAVSVWVDVDGEPGLRVKYARDARTGRLVVAGLLLERAAVTAEMLRAIPIGRIEHVANLGGEGEDPADLPPLTRPKRQSAGDSEAFLRLVARHFRAWSARSPHPAARMAEASGVKSPTIHTWIREARMEGFLPLRPRGKAGGVDLSERDED